MRRYGLPLQVTGLVVGAMGLALVLTAALLAVDSPLPPPAPLPQGNTPVAWGLSSLTEEPTLPRVVTPGQEHEVHAERIVTHTWDPALASADVEVYLILAPPGAPVPDTPADAGPDAWVLMERHTFTGPGQAWDARLASDFLTLPAPEGGYPEGWQARLGHQVTYRWADGRETPVAAPGAVDERVQVGDPALAALFPANGTTANVLLGLGVTALGAGVWGCGFRRYRRENLVVRIRPAVLSDGPRAS